MSTDVLLSKVSSLPGLTILIKLTLKILFLTVESVSALNSTRIPSARSIPSTLYPVLPSIVENTSVVKLSIRSTPFLAVVP